MTRPLQTLLTFLAVALLVSLAAPAVDANVPRARHYHVGHAITLDTNLLSTSGASAWAINDYLASTTSLPPLGNAFIAAEERYGINARFLVAAAMHESGWGTSYIARRKHNLFGYNAFDRDPSRYASAYATYAANIDATARFIKDFYLTPGGRWWGGAPTLRSMQRFWSSSHRWGIGVSHIASSIHLPTFAGSTFEFTTPSVSGGLHGGDQATVQLGWAGGTIPAGVEFVARWVPVELDVDAVAAVPSPVANAETGAVDGVLSASPTNPAITTAAPRTRSMARSITLTAAAPSKPGRYLLEVDMRDTGGGPLPSAQRVHIPGVPVRIGSDRAVSVDVEPSLDGTGAIVRITNIGRVAIPAVSSHGMAGVDSAEPKPSLSVLTVTASSSGSADVAAVTLLSVPLDADLQPGTSRTFDIPAITSATGRTINWLAVSLSVLGDPNVLAASLPYGVWMSNGRDATVQPGLAARQTVVVDHDP
jgi:hypothetical protein